MPHEVDDCSSPALLYALRLGPPSLQQELQGEIEHVVSGERCRFRDASSLVAWLHSRSGPAPLSPAQTALDVAPGLAPRDATM